VSEDAVTYFANGAYFQVTSSERDGTDVKFGAMQSSVGPEACQTNSISLSVVLGTVEAARRSQQQKGPPQRHALTLEQAFDRWLPTLLNADAELFDKLSRLRFWHTGKWPTYWGQTITMTAAEAEENKALMVSVAAALPNDA
jgi:hypothetical protein